MSDKDEHKHEKDTNNNKIINSNSGEKEKGHLHQQHHDPVLECQIFERGFGQFLRSGDFSDVTVVAKDNQTYSLHRIILAYSSKYFAKLFDELDKQKEKDEKDNKNGNNNNNVVNNNSGHGDDEKEKDVIQLEGPFTQYFHYVVKYMYEGRVEFNAENAIPLLAMANFYQIKELKNAASDYLLSSITRENALTMLQKAIHFDAEEVANKCITVICKNFNQIASMSFPSSTVSQSSTSTSVTVSHHIPTTNSSITLNSLPLPVVIRIMKQNNLAVSSEFVVYKTVCSYIEANKAQLNQQDITSLFETVRFPWLTYQQLAETEENMLVPRHLLTEALLLRLKQHEVPTAKDSKRDTTDETHPPQNPRLQPRAAYAISLEYHSDFDEHGLFYYIGTNGFKEEWSNPGIRGRVRVTCSSQEKGNVVDVVGRAPTECWTMDVPASWIMINLGSSRSLVPNYYTLRHGGNSKADCLRNWTLQGSNDAKNWTVLIRHSNDTSLNGNFATCSWPIPNCTQAYRYFRVLQTGRNSSNHNFLSLSGIEFYGDLYETRKDEREGFVP
jgi:hypothetical protein